MPQCWPLCCCPFIAFVEDSNKVLLYFGNSERTKENVEEMFLIRTKGMDNKVLDANMSILMKKCVKI